MEETSHPGPRTQPGAESAPETVAPGALSALLAELVRVPEDAPLEPPPGTVIGRFELKRKLGAGGFGVVWEARDRQLGRSVAFKLVRPGERSEFRAQSLLREAEAAARLSHDNLAALYDVGQSEHGPYLVFELLHGKTLAERLAEGPLARTEALRVLRDVARGVAHAHAEGVVHRDLKPANVFVCDDGRVKVLDFGLAHAFGRRRQSGGTPAYMAPEQWREAPEDERTDVFALGVMAYQLLSGALPFVDEKATTGGQPAPALEVPGTPELGELTTRMLEKDPVRRPRDAGELLPVLDAALLALERAGADSSAPVRTRRHPRWRLAGMVAAGAALGVAVALGLVALRRPAPRADGKLLVAVADIVNETGERELDVLSGLLVTSLEQSRKLEVMTQTRVLDLAAQAGRAGLTRVDEATGRAVASSASATALLLPAIRRLGATYAVELRAIDPVKDVHLFSVSDRASTKEGLFDLLDRLSEKARRELKEDPAEVEQSRVQLGQAMTRSVEAYQHYLAGVEARHGGGSGARAVALREQLRAIELDPQFAAAHAHLAWTYDVYGRPELAKPHWEAADRWLDRMPEKERTLLLLFRARGSTGRPDLAEARRLADLLIERWPQDKYVLYVACLNPEPAAVLRIDRERTAKAEAALRRAVALDPGGLSVELLVKYLGQRSPEALELARSAVATRPGVSQQLLLARVLLAHGRPEEAKAAAIRGLELNGLESSVRAVTGCEQLRALGAIEACLPFLGRLEAEGQNEFERDEARLHLTYNLWMLGRRREALGVCARGRCGFPEAWVLSCGVDRHRPSPAAVAAARKVEDRNIRRLLLAWLGDLAGAAEADAAIPAADRWPEAEGEYLALVAGAQGRHAEAAQRAGEAVKADKEAEFVTYEYLYLLAEALLASGDAAGAAGVPGRYPDPAQEADYAYVEYRGYPDLALVRARALERLGRPAEAVKELDGILALWKGADEDLPRLIEVKAMRARLAGPAR